MNNKHVQEIFKKAMPKIHFPQIKVLALFLIALLKAKTTNLVKIAETMNLPQVQATKYKRLTRFFLTKAITKPSYASLIMQLFDLEKEPLTLALDRTNWKIGTVEVNFLSLVYCIGKIAIPLHQILLPKKGNSNCAERIQLLKEFRELYPNLKIKLLLGDREFIGCHWLNYLAQHKIPFALRIRQDFYFKAEQKPKKQVQNNVPKSSRAAPKVFNAVEVMQHKVNLAISRTANQEIIAVISSIDASQALQAYRQRWDIESLFLCLKTRGFRLEDTNLKDLEKLDYLFQLLSIALCLAVKTGQILAQDKKLPLKKHKRLQISLFQAGLRQLKTLLENFELYADLISLLKMIFTRCKRNFRIKNYAY